MRVGLRKRIPGEIEFGLIYGSIAALGLVALNVLSPARLLPSCPLYGLTGLPCPTCGGTRAALALSRGDIVTAFSLNPLVTTALAGIFMLLLENIFAIGLNLPRLSVAFSEREKTVLRLSAVMAVSAQWIYLAIAL